ncbi:MAG: proteasome subunit beta [Candidatus Hadarchaeales archaeon]
MYEFAGTVVGLRCKDGVVLASDTKGTYYYHVLSKSVRKVFPVDDVVGAAFAGSSGDVQNLVNLLKAEANLYKLEKNRQISPRNVAQIASNILHGRRFFPYIMEGMIGGMGEDGPALFFMDAVGGKLEERKFAAAGTGATVAYGVFEKEYSEKMGVKEGAKLAAAAIKAAIERDAATGERTVVAIIDGKGYHELAEREVEELLK